MIQRIQTLFLFLAAAAAFGLYALPFASTSQTVESSANFSDAIFNLQDNIGLMILFGAAGLLALIAIFMFKNRNTQLLLSRISIVTSVVGLILAFILFYNDSGNIPDETVAINDEMGLYLPPLFIVFALLAIRFINKDNKLVSSMDRLR